MLLYAAIAMICTMGHCVPMAPQIPMTFHTVQECTNFIEQANKVGGMDYACQVVIDN